MFETRYVWRGLLLVGMGLSALACGGSDEATATTADAGASTVAGAVAAAGHAGTVAAAAGGGAGKVASAAGHSGTAPAAGSGGHTVAGGAALPAAGSGGGTAGSGGSGAGSSQSGETSGEPDADGGVKSDALYATLEVKNVAPGEEQHVCVVVELPNSEPVWVDQLLGTLTEGSHHLIVDRQPASATLEPTPTPCSPTVGGDTTRLMIVQQRESRVVLPQNVGHKLDPHQKVYLQLHYINMKAEPLTIRGRIELQLMAPTTTPKEVLSVFTGSTSIALQPHSPGATKFFLPLTAAKMDAWNVFALTSHTHKLGVHSTIERVASMDAPDSKPLHESRDWAEPPLTMFSPPLRFEGSDGLRLVCNYMNDTDRTVTFGVNADNEMCFMWLYYFAD